MARSKNSLTDVSPASGQLKSSFSNLEQVQLDALKQSSGSFSTGAGKINGSVANAMQNFSYRDRSKLEIGGLFAEGLEKAGVTRGGSGKIISSVVSNSIDNRKPFYRNTQGKEIDLSISSNRTPDPYKKSPQETMKEKRETLVGRDDLNYGGLTFPPDLSFNAHAYMQLQLWSYHRPSSQAKGSINRGEVIYLPLPEDFQVEYGVNYGELDTGVVGGALASTVDSVGQDAIGRAVASAKGGGTMMDTMAAAASNLDAGEALKYLGYSTLASASPVIGGLVGQETGQVANPHPSLFLNGVNLREFTFSWTLVPRKSSEAEVIKNIISTLKKECLPKKKDAFLTYPKMIQPKVINADFGGDYKKCMMATLSVNYTAAGTSAFFYDGNPVAIQLSIGFHEAELYLEDIAPVGASSLTNEVLGENNILQSPTSEAAPSTPSPLNGDTAPPPLLRRGGG